MLVGLVSLTFFFGGLILAYGLIIQQQLAWQQFRIPGVLWVGLVFLGLSSWFLESARYALRRALVVIYRERVAITIVLAIGFLAVQGVAAANLIRNACALCGRQAGHSDYFRKTGRGARFHVPHHGVERENRTGQT